MSNEFAVLDLDGKPMAFTTLPYEMHLKILSYLSAKDLYERVFSFFLFFPRFLQADLCFIDATMNVFAKSFVVIMP